METGDSVGLLTRLGLTSYEAKAYLALMRRDSSTAAQASRLAEVPRQRIYDVLASLVEKGFATTRPGRVVKYAPVAPELAIDSLVARQRQELVQTEAGARQMIEQLKPQFAAGKEHTDPLEFIEVLRDLRAVSERFGELQAGIKDEILVFSKPPYAQAPQENVEGIELTATHDTWSVYELSAFDDPDFVEGVRRFIEAGEKARFVEVLPLKLVIIDAAVVMFGMEDPVAGDAALTMMVVEHPQLALVLKTAFMAIWESGLTFDEASELRGRQRETAPAA